MKYLFFSLFLVLNVSSFAQVEVVVTLKNKSFSIGEVPAFVSVIPQGDYAQVKKDWERYLGKNTKEKPTEVKGEIIITNKEYEKISATALTIYSYLKEYDGKLMLACAFQLNEQFISREMDEETYLPAKKYLRDFVVETYKNAVSDQLKIEQKALKKLEVEKLRLMRSKESDLLEIKQLDRAILTKKDQTTLNKIDQSNKVIQMQAQKQLVLKLANAGEKEKDEAQKILKELERDFKKLQKQYEGLHQDINHKESYIRQSEVGIAKLEGEVKFIQLDIEDQGYKLRKIQQKLDGIQ